MFNRQKLLVFAKYISFFFVFYILSIAGINEKVFPFAVGFYFSLVWCNQNPLICSLLYLACKVATSFSVYSLIGGASIVLLLLLFYSMHQKFKKPIKPFLFAIYGLIAQSVNVFIEIYFNNANIPLTLITLILSMLFMYVCNQFFTALLVRGVKFRLISSDCICAGIILMAISLGLTSLNIYNFEFIKLFAVFVILFTAFSFGINVAIVSACLIGIGSILSVGNAMYVAPFVAYAITIAIFKTRIKIIPIISILAVELTFGFALNIYYSYNFVSFLPVLIACLLFLCIKENVYSRFSGLFELSKEKIAMKNIVNRSRENLCKRFNDLSEVFSEMDKVFSSMVNKNGVSDDVVKNMITSELKSKICADCKECNRCHRTFEKEINAVFEELIVAALERGKVTLLDISPFLTARCSRLNNIVGTINQISSEYKKYAGFVGNVDTSKLLIAKQLGGVSDIMKQLSEEVKNNVSFDYFREEKIIEELAFNNIICADVVIYEKNIDITNVTLVVRNEDALKTKIAKVVSKICAHSMEVYNQQPAKEKGYTILNLRTQTKYDVIFGVASAKKESSNQSGDCYSLIRIESDKILLALCDGMGSGEKAQKTSELSISLIENFYKAGFENNLILSSVNGLLTINNDEMFSTLDLCVLNLRKGFADFVKLGATCSLIKHENQTEILDGESLPLGIVEEMKPTIHKSVLNCGDMIVLASDGVSDSFNSEEEYRNFVNNIDSLNPQQVADEILKKARNNDGNISRDDMTVLVSKIFSK